jgi:hypothetical protein
MQNKSTGIVLKKIIDDLNGPCDVLYEPRSWSPDDLKDACNNLDIFIPNQISLLSELVIHYILKNFFYMQHQTGLYNPQRKLWSSLAQTKSISIKSHTLLFDLKKQNPIEDIYFYNPNGRYVKARIVLAGANNPYAGFDDLINRVSNKCCGLFYFSEREPDPLLLNKILIKTNAKDPFDRYFSPINKNCSLNLLQYGHNANRYFFSLVHPNLGRKVEAELCLAQ